MIRLDHGPQRIGTKGRIAAVAGIDLREVLVPVVIHPRRARAAAPVEEELDATRDQVVIAGRLVRFAAGGLVGDQLLRLGHGSPPPPEREHAHGELACCCYGLVGIPRLLADSGVLEPRHSLFVEGCGQRCDPLTLLLRCIRRYEARDQPLRGFLEHTRRRAIRIAVDRATGRILRFARHAGQLQGQRVGNAVVPRSVRQPHGMTRRDLVQVFRHNEAAFLELPLVPSMTEHPAPGLRPFHLRGNRRLHLVDGLDVGITEVEVVEPIGATLGKVRVGVEQSWGHRQALEVDALRAPTGQCQRHAIRPHGDNLSVFDSDGLSD